MNIGGSLRRYQLLGILETLTDTYALKNVLWEQLGCARFLLGLEISSAFLRAYQVYEKSGKFQNNVIIVHIQVVSRSKANLQHNLSDLGASDTSQCAFHHDLLGCQKLNLTLCI